MMAPNCSLLGFWSLHIFCSLFLITNAKIHQDEDDVWIDPFDMLNYDPTTKRMRKPTETASYPNMPTKRREFNSESCEAQQCPDVSECTSKLESLQKEFDEQKKKRTTTSSQYLKPGCLPVFKRFFSSFLKEISELGLPDDGQTSMHYDAEVKLSKQSLVEIQKFLNEENDWTTGAMDEALNQILVRIKVRDHEAWKWHFEDTFCVDADTALKVSLIVLIVVAIICTELWSVVSCFFQFWRMFAVCFFISLTRKLFHLYKEFYSMLPRSPYRFIMYNLKQIGQGINEFLRALLKDLPITLQLPVLLIIALAISVFMYGGLQAVCLLLLGWRRDQPPPAVGQRQALKLRKYEEAWESEAPQPLQDNRNRVNQAGTQGDQGFRAGDAYDPQNKKEDGSMGLPQNFSSSPRVETLRAAGNMSRDDETDFQQRTEEVDPSTKENAVSADLAVKEGLSFTTPVQETHQ